MPEMPPLDRWLPRLHDRLAELGEAHGVPGAACGVVLDGAEVVATTGTANVATGVDVDPATVFQLGSLSTLYTATLLMQAHCAGLVHLDEPVRAALHSFRLLDDAATLEITPRHLLTHTSGIEGDHLPAAGSGADALERYVASLAGIGQLHPPDELYSWCSSGFVVAGRVVEALTGESFDHALRRRLAGALGPAATTRADAAILRRVAAGHLPLDDAPERWRPCWGLHGADAPVRGILSPVDELLGFARLHLGRGIAPSGSELLPGDAIASMQEPHTESYGVGTRQALGWTVWDWDGTEVIGGDGHAPGQRSFLRVLPERRCALALLTNAPTGEALAEELLPWIAGELLDLTVPGVPEDVAPSAAAEEETDHLAGTYGRLHQRLEVLAGEGRVAMTVVPDDALRAEGHEEAVLELQPMASGRYRTSDPRTGVARIVTFVDTEGEGPADYLHHGGRAHRRLGG